MIKTIRKVGDSMGVILPSSEIKALGVSERDPVLVTIDKGTISLSPLKRKPQIEDINKRTDDLIKRYHQTLVLLAEK